MLIVIDPPCLDQLFGVIDRQELMHVQALVAQAPVERFDMRVVRGFSRPCEIELHAALERPCFQRFRHELRAVIDRNRGRIALLGADRLQGRDDITAGE